MDSTAELIDSIVRIRQTRLTQLICVCLVCGAVFLFSVSQLAAIVFPATRQTAQLKQSAKPNLWDGKYDDVEPEEVPESQEELDEVNRGKRLMHGVDLALNRYTTYNADVERVSAEYGSPAMLQESRRDIKMLSPEGDDWKPSLDGTREQGPVFTTYNTLTGQ